MRTIKIVLLLLAVGSLLVAARTALASTEDCELDVHGYYSDGVWTGFQAGICPPVYCDNESICYYWVRPDGYAVCKCQSGPVQYPSCFSAVKEDGTAAACIKMSNCTTSCPAPEPPAGSGVTIFACHCQ